MNQFWGRENRVPDPKYLTKDEAAFDNPMVMFKAVSVRMEARRKKATEAYTKLLRSISTEEDNAYAEIETLVKAREAEAKRLAEPGCRKRQPLKIVARNSKEEGRYLPPTVTSQILEDRIDLICGCQGRNDCDCVSIFGQATRELWTEYNSGIPYSAEQRRIDTSA